MLFQDHHWHFNFRKEIGREEGEKKRNEISEGIVSSDCSSNWNTPKMVDYSTNRAEQKDSHIVIALLILSSTHTRTMSAPIILATLALFSPTILPTAQ